MFTLQGHAGSVQSIAWSPDGKLIAVGFTDTTVSAVQVWNVDERSEVFNYLGTPLVQSVAWSPDSKRIASAGSLDGTVQVWNASDGSGVFTYHGHSRWVNAVAWSPDGKRIASGSDDTTVQVWHPE